MENKYFYVDHNKIENTYKDKKNNAYTDILNIVADSIGATTVTLFRG